MRLAPLELRGAYVVEVEPHVDDRGLFARTWSLDEFAEHGLGATWVECSTSFNVRAGTVRGLHFQDEPRREVKLVRCVRGAAFDVVVDLRPDSSTYRGWVGVEITADNRRGIYVPEGFAHGFQTLVDGTELTYQISERYDPELARGVRWDDPAIGVEWPECADRVISERDLALPSLRL
jgi:dTDP-4-dehydrorhamnose 3,5-epimerase